MPIPHIDTRPATPISDSGGARPRQIPQQGNPIDCTLSLLLADQTDGDCLAAELGDPVAGGCVSVVVVGFVI